MKISTKGRYAVRLMLDLALHSAGEPVPLKEIAARQGMGESYLESIVKQLARPGLVRSVRGSGGGYRLSRTPEQYTVGEILRQMEGGLVPVNCDSVMSCEGGCAQVDNCVTMEVWLEVQQAINGVVDHITLADLVARYERKTAAREQEN